MMTAKPNFAFVDLYGDAGGTTSPFQAARLVLFLGIKPTDIEPLPMNYPFQPWVPVGESGVVPRRADFGKPFEKFTTVALHALSKDVDLQIQAFEKNSWVTIGRLPAQTIATLKLPILLSRTSW